MSEWTKCEVCGRPEIDFCTCKKEEKTMDKCTQCESDRIFLLDAENEECDCGAVYCADCEAEYSKEGELLAFGLVM